LLFSKNSLFPAKQQEEQEKTSKNISIANLYTIHL
jgi:hypothetical protein